MPSTPAEKILVSSLPNRMALIEHSCASICLVMVWDESSGKGLKKTIKRKTLLYRDRQA